MRDREADEKLFQGIASRACKEMHGKECQEQLGFEKRQPKFSTWVFSKRFLVCLICVAPEGEPSAGSFGQVSCSKPEMKVGKGRSQP